MRAKTISVLALAFLATGSASAETVPTAGIDGSAGGDSAPSSLQVRLDSREEYRLRSSPGESDQDVNLALDAAASSSSGAWGANASLGLWWDLDGNPSGTSFGLASVYDQKSPWVDVYQLSAEYQGNGPLRFARAGRQSAAHGRAATFDGGYLRLRPASWLGLFAFGGRTEHFFESEGGLFEDWIASTGAALHPTDWLRLEADYRFMTEALDGTAGGERVAVQDHSYGLTAWLRRGETFRFKCWARGLDDGFAEAGAQGHAFWAEKDLGLDARFAAQPVSLDELNELDNPFFLTLGRSLPHVRWRLDGWKGGGLPALRWEAHVGYEGRQLLHDDETAFNRNSSRVYALASVEVLKALPGLSATLSLERVSDESSPFTGEGLWALGGVLGFERGRLRAEAGTQYQRYRYLYYRDLEELADVRTFYGGLEYRATDWLRARARYSAEIFDRTLHTFAISFFQAY